MGRQKFWKLEELEDRHPGLCGQVEAMFTAFISLRRIAAALQAQYGERISKTSIGTYKKECWIPPRRSRVVATKAVAAAPALSGASNSGTDVFH